MPYDKNRGRAAGTPGFYRDLGKKHTHGENTGEWTRDDHARRGESGPRKGERPPRDAKPFDKSDAARRAPRPEFKPAPRPDSPLPREGMDYVKPEPHGGRMPARGTRNSAVSPDRPIYQNAFKPAPGPRDGMAQPPVRRPAQPPMPPAPPVDERDDELMDNLIVGRNPIREAIKNGRELERILVQRGELSGSAREIIAKARENRVVVQEVDKSRLDAIYPNHQGMIAFASAANYSTVEAMLACAAERGEQPFLIVLDGITDPHNLGAIIRTAECVGAHGVILQQRRSVGLTPAAVKAAAGAAEYMKVAKVVNITRTLAELKEKRIWVIGADMDGQPLGKTDMSGAVALVIGAEGEGISRLVRDECDMIVSLPMRGHIQSLNASVAAGVMMYAVDAARGN